MQEFDYLDLLRKYMAHVADIEGVTFVSGFVHSMGAFTTEEWEELRRLDKELD